MMTFCAALRSQVHRYNLRNMHLSRKHGKVCLERSHMRMHQTGVCRPWRGQVHSQGRSNRDFARAWRHSIEQSLERYIICLHSQLTIPVNKHDKVTCLFLSKIADLRELANYERLVQLRRDAALSMYPNSHSPPDQPQQHKQNARSHP